MTPAKTSRTANDINGGVVAKREVLLSSFLFACQLHLKMQIRGSVDPIDANAKQVTAVFSRFMFPLQPSLLHVSVPYQVYLP